MCERLNKGARLDLSGHMQGEVTSKSEPKKALETLSESQEDHLYDTIGEPSFVDLHFIADLINLCCAVSLYVIW